MNDGRRKALFGFMALGSVALADNFVGTHGETLAKKAIPHEGPAINEAANKMVNEILRSNEYYVSQKGAPFFENFKNKQIPRATVVGCSDSRFQTGVLDSTPENDLFVIRNIGNQYSSNEGSVAYGVHHLHTPLLLIVGHSRCGAVKAALSNYTEESSSIRKELDSLSLSMRRVPLTGNDNLDWLNGVVENVHQQIVYANAVFGHEVKEGKLTIVGVVYDLANDFGSGYGKLRIVNINGETNPAKIATNPLFSSIKH